MFRINYIFIVFQKSKGDFKVTGLLDIQLKHIVLDAITGLNLAELLNDSTSQSREHNMSLLSVST